MPDQSSRLDPVGGSDFEALYRDRFAETVRLAGFLLGDLASAEDVAQDAFVRLHPRFSVLDNPGGYLRTTVVNICRNRKRSVRRESSRFARHGVTDDVVSDRAAELDATLRRLPYEERAVIVLRYWLGLSEAEIAEHLGCRPGTVKSRASRALKRVRKELS